MKSVARRNIANRSPVCTRAHRCVHVCVKGDWHSQTHPRCRASWLLYPTLGVVVIPTSPFMSPSVGTKTAPSRISYRVVSLAHMSCQSRASLPTQSLCPAGLEVVEGGCKGKGASVRVARRNHPESAVVRAVHGMVGLACLRVVWATGPPLQGVLEARR